MEKVTVITVNLNNSIGLLDTINSVLNQTYINKEYLIIDGGSTDNSVNIITQYSQKIDFWISEPDLGIYDAMNKGIKVAKGEWIIFMNSGDTFYEDETLETIFNNKSYKNIDIIYGNIIYKNSNSLWIAPSKIRKKYFFFDTICHQSLFTNIKSFNKIGYYDLKFNFISDMEWLLKAKTSLLNFQYVNIVIAKWDDDGICKQNSKLLSNEIQILRKYYFNKYEHFYIINQRRLKRKIYKIFCKFKTRSLKPIACF